MIDARRVVLLVVLISCDQRTAQVCAPANAGLVLPPEFCAQIVADSVGAARHVTVLPSGEIVIALREEKSPVLLLRDDNGDGIADRKSRFGPPIGVDSPYYRRGGTGIAYSDGYLYFASDTSVLRWQWHPGDTAPRGDPETVVTELPYQLEHAAKAIVVDKRGMLFVNIGAPSNACQQQDRAAGSRGLDPCPHLDSGAGIWRFDAGRPLQRRSDGTRFALGLRNVLALAVAPDSVTLWGVQHGRDLLHENWGELRSAFSQRKGADNPGEEMVRIDEGADYGWPYCYFDMDVNRKVLAPEYGGDGASVGRCVNASQPMLVFPAHWAPESMVFYTAMSFPQRYRGGAFVAFHGSWKRKPNESGFLVAFVPFRNGTPAREFEVFASGFRDDSAAIVHQPMGLAVAPDGSLIVTDDLKGRVWRICRSSAAGSVSANGTHSCMRL